MSIRLIVGLGNPGAEYAGTRHNIGFDVVDRLATRHGIPVRLRRHRAVLGDGVIEGRRVILARPMTYMNLSGEAVGSVARMYRFSPVEVLILVDDVALPVGKLRLRMKGSSGGHNGLKSIEQSLNSQEYARIRIGVGGPRRGAMIGHVLGRAGSDEKESLAIAVERAADAVEMSLREGFEKAMNQFNRDPAAADQQGDRTLTGARDESSQKEIERYRTNKP